MYLDAGVFSFEIITKQNQFVNRNNAYYQNFKDPNSSHLGTYAKDYYNTRVSISEKLLS